MEKTERIELSEEELDALLKRAETNTLSEEDCKIIKGMAETILVLSNAVDEKGSSIKRLLKAMFGAKTESSKNILDAAPSDKPASAPGKDKRKSKKKKRKGHGRKGAAQYTGAEKVRVAHTELQPGTVCPLCKKGKVYPLRTPGTVVRVTGKTPLQATVYELEKLRCNGCLEVFTAKLPEKAGTEKYDEAAGSIITLLKYGNGFPFYRLDNFQESLGVPLPASTQWKIVETVSDKIHPVYLGLVRLAAQGKLIHNDDTTVKVLELIKENLTRTSRKGMFTTGFLSIVDERRLALFYTGRNHAGENMSDLLRQRNEDIPTPTHMCDALSRNPSKDFKTVLANCLVHARRNFVEIADNFPKQCQFVIDTIRDVYRNDTKAKHLTPEERLKFHQLNSGPIMGKLRKWLNIQIREKKAEPNSGLGKAIRYMLRHWKKLTMFMKLPGVPLDNNICEQLLKRAILHRKNSMFYKTQHGAYIGDMFMSIIHTCKLEKVNPFEYITALQKYSEHLTGNAEKWMPWNYKEAVAALA